MYFLHKCFLFQNAFSITNLYYAALSYILFVRHEQKKSLEVLNIDTKAFRRYKYLKI